MSKFQKFSGGAGPQTPLEQPTAHYMHACEASLYPPPPPPFFNLWIHPWYDTQESLSNGAEKVVDFSTSFPQFFGEPSVAWY